MSPLQLHAKACPSHRKYVTVPGQGRCLLATRTHLPLGTVLIQFLPVSVHILSKQNAQGLYPWER